MKISNKNDGKVLKVLYRDEKGTRELLGIYKTTILSNATKLHGQFLVNLETINGINRLVFTELKMEYIKGIHISKLTDGSGKTLRQLIATMDKDKESVFKATKEKAYAYAKDCVEAQGVSSYWQYSAIGGKTCEGNDLFKEVKSWFITGKSGIRLTYYSTSNKPTIGIRADFINGEYHIVRTISK